MTVDPTTTIISILLALVMLAITIEDVRRFIVPDVLSLPAIPAGLAVAGILAPSEFAAVTILENCAAMALGALMFYAVRFAYQHFRGFEGLGLGDVKLAALAATSHRWACCEGHNHRPIDVAAAASVGGAVRDSRQTKTVHRPVF